jgi:flagellar biosynthesis protein FlhF
VEPVVQQDLEDIKTQVAEELSGMKALLQQMLQKQTGELAPAPAPVAEKAVQAIEGMSPLPRLPAALRGILDGMRQGRVDISLRRLVQEKVQEKLTLQEQEDPTKVYQEAVAAIASNIQVGPGLEEIGRRHDKPFLLVLVGPTGVGKTTTLAKLAAGFQFQYGLKAAFLTLDTYRIGAPEQLKQYAEIIDIPIRVVFKPEDLRTAVNDFSDRDVVLIDTVGRSHRNKEDIEDLARYLDGLENAEVLLVLSANTKQQDLREALHVFQDLGVKGLIMSKLDETSSYEDMITLMVREEIPVHFVTTGQSVPDDIQPAQAEDLARLITPTPPEKKRSRKGGGAGGKVSEGEDSPREAISV